MLAGKGQVRLADAGVVDQRQEHLAPAGGAEDQHPELVSGRQHQSAPVASVPSSSAMPLS